MTQRKRNRTVTIAVVLVAALVAVLVGAEVYVRNRATACLAQSFESELGTGVDVDLSWKPVLLQLLDRQVPSVALDSDDTAFGPAQQMQVHAEVNDVDLRDSAEAPAPSAARVLTSRGPPPGSSRPCRASRSAASSPMSWPTRTRAPDVHGRRPGSRGVHRATGGERRCGDGRDDRRDDPRHRAPDGLVDGVVEILTSGLQQYPLGMQATEVNVTDSGIDLRLEGGRFVLPEAPQGQQQQQQEGSCGLLS